MYLPVILLHRFGWPGLLAFAIPNVLGCAAFGYVLSRRRGAELRQRHRGAIIAFSVVTVAYHLYFAAWAAETLGLVARDDAWSALIAAGVVLGASVLVSFLPARAWPAAGVLAYAISCAAFARTGFEPLAHLPHTGTEPAGDVANLIPVFTLGFLLCPYLDATFHRARQAAPSRHAFAVFGVTFAAMLALTAAYAGIIGVNPLPILIVHLGAQSIFTCAAHLRELRSPELLGPRGRTGLLSALPLAAALLILLSPLAPIATRPDDPVYVRFLVFYGLLFPAYVLFFIVPPRPLPRTPVALGLTFLLAVAVMPLYEIGFIQLHIGWLAVAVGVLVVVKLATAARRAPGRSVMI
jgi:hypothetical protein